MIREENISNPPKVSIRPAAMGLMPRATDVPRGMAAEAQYLGLGLLQAHSLAEDEALTKLVDPRRQVIEPRAADDLFQSLGRRDSAQEDSYPDR
jgi:hypothetical protein